MRFTTFMAACVAGALSGCVQDPYLRLPQLMPRHPLVERRAAEFHDPFPDETNGPKVDGRPRDWGQRAPARQAADLRGLHILGPDAHLPAPTTTAERSFPSSVRP